MSFTDLVNRVDVAARAHLGGTSITYTPTVGDAEVITALYDRIGVETDFAEYAQAADFMPAIFVAVDDLPSDPETDDPTITISGADYKIQECEPDSVSGSMRILLRKV